MTSYCVDHIQCPKCRETGHDRSRNNLAVYSDGSKYCFRCGYLETASGIQRLQTGNNYSDKPVGKTITLPSDADGVLGVRGRRFLQQYALTERDVQVNMIMWSDYYQRLIFPYFDSTGLIGWQGRYLGDQQDKAKWFSQGDLKNITHVVGNPHSKVCVVVEDIISAIKVSHNPQVCVVPLFGSHISMSKALRLKKICDRLLVWLDKDVQTKAVKYAHTAQNIGLPAHNIITDKDPKSYSDQEISEILNAVAVN